MRRTGWRWLSSGTIASLGEAENHLLTLSVHRTQQAVAIREGSSFPSLSPSLNVPSPALLLLFLPLPSHRSNHN